MYRENSRLSKIEKNPYWESIGYNNKGSIYEAQGKLKDAIIYFDKAYDIIKNDHTLSKHLAMIYHNKGKVLKAQGQLQKSYEIELKALQIAISLKDKLTVAHIHNSLGIIARTLGKIMKQKSIIDQPHRQDLFRFVFVMFYFDWKILFFFIQIDQIDLSFFFQNTKLCRNVNPFKL